MTATSRVVTDHIIEGDTGRVYVVDRTVWTDAQGNVIGEQVHRRPIEPDADVSAEDGRTQAIIEAERIAAPSGRPAAPEGTPRTAKGKKG